MATNRTSFLLGQNQNFDENLIDYHPYLMDYGRLIVRLNLPDHTHRKIGEVVTEINGEETKYISLDTKGRELFTATSDFNTVNEQFEKYARVIVAQEISPEKHQTIENNYQSPLTKSNLMKPNSQSPEQKQKKVNQLFFIESEKPSPEGHFINIKDSYGNEIGNIFKLYSDPINKYEYIAFDHEGNLMSKNEKLWSLKKEFTDNSELLREQARQRRIAIKEKAMQPQEPVQRLTDKEKRKHEIQNLRTDRVSQEKNISKENTQPKEKQNVNKEREQELNDLREERENDFGDVEIDL